MTRKLRMLMIESDPIEVMDSRDDAKNAMYGPIVSLLANALWNEQDKFPLGTKLIITFAEEEREDETIPTD